MRIGYSIIVSTSFLCAVSLCLATPSAADPASMAVPLSATPPIRPFLSLEAAERGAKACLDLAGRQGLRVAIAIRDRGGNLVLFKRMDDVFVKQLELALLKAETGATTPLSTRDLGKIVKQPDSALAGIEEVPGIIVVEGGEPIKNAAGYSLGGVGVSGASPSQDGECARAAVAAIIQ